MFGDDVLVAPVLQEGMNHRSVSLPPGHWYDYWTDSAAAGGTWVNVAAPIDRIPFFVRSGAILPTRQTVQFSTQAPIDPLTLSVYCAEPGKTDSTMYYEDDGHTFDYSKGAYFKRRLAQSVTSSQVTFSASSGDGSYVPPSRSVQIRFVGIGKEPGAVMLNGTEVHQVKGSQIAKKGPSWSYDGKMGRVTVWLPETRERYDVVLERSR